MKTIVMIIQEAEQDIPSSMTLEDAKRELSSVQRRQERLQRLVDRLQAAAEGKGSEA